MHEKVILVIEDIGIKETVLTTLKTARTGFTEIPVHEVMNLPADLWQVVVWGSNGLGPESCERIQRFTQQRPNCPVVCLVDNFSMREGGDIPEDIEGTVHLPADPIFFDKILSQAMLAKNTMRNIRITGGRVSQVEDELEMFLRVARAIASSLELNEVLTSIMTISGRLIKSEAWSLALRDTETGELVFEAALGHHGQQIRGLRIPKGKGVIGWVAEHGEPLIVADTANDDRHFKEVDKNVGFESKSILCLPLKSKGKILGAIEFINKVGKGQFCMEDIDRVRVFVDLASVAIENALLYQRVARLSERDELTGLYNQRTLIQKLNEELKAAEQTGQPLAYLFLDLDRFKRINDQHGHLMGRQTLKEVGILLNDLQTEKTIMGRYGGDEFWVIIPGAERKEAVQMAENIRARIEQQSFLKGFGLDIHITASLGVALYPEQAMTFDDLARLADQALYQAKQQERNKVICAFTKKSL